MRSGHGGEGRGVRLFGRWVWALWVSYAMSSPSGVFEYAVRSLNTDSLLSIPFIWKWDIWKVCQNWEHLALSVSKISQDLALNPD